VVELEEDPLGPFEIVGVGGIDFASPIVAEAEGFDLAPERCDVLFGGLARVLAGFDGVLFSGQAEGVPADGMQDMKAAGATVSGEDVGGRVAFRMADVETGAGGVGEHVEDIELGGEIGRCEGGSLKSVTACEGMIARRGIAWIPRPEGLIFFPIPLPLRLDQMERILPARA
jgi:hypothetical protein